MRIKTFLLVLAILVLSSTGPVHAVTEQHLTAYVKNRNPHHELSQRLQAFCGTLLGFDGGEWGGELFFVKPPGPARRLLEGNVFGIVQTSHGVFVFTGMAHLFDNYGDVYQVLPGPHGPWALHLLKLQGAPMQIRPMLDGSISFILYNSSPDPLKTRDMPFLCQRFDKRAIVESRHCGKPVN